MDNHMIKNEEIIRLYIENDYNELAKVIQKNYETDVIPVGENTDLDENVEDLLLFPRNFCFLGAVTRDDTMIFSTLITAENQIGFYHNEEETQITTVKAVTIDEAVTHLKELQGIDAPKETTTNLILSREGLICLVALADSIKRNHLEELILHLIDESEPGIEELEEIYELSFDSKDLRWYLPFMMDAFGPFSESDSEYRPDFKKGVGELENLGLLKETQDKLELTEEGYGFMNILLQKRSLAALRSLFYEQDNLYHMSVAFMSFDKLLYYIMPSDKEGEYVLKSIDEEKYSELIEMIIAAGDEPKIVDKIQTEPEDKETHRVEAVEADVRFCRFCGAKVSIAAKFCNKCGESLVENKV